MIRYKQIRPLVKFNEKIKKIKDSPGNETWEIISGKEKYRINKSNVGWRISDSKGKISILGLKFANTPEEALEIRKRGDK